MRLLSSICIGNFGHSNARYACHTFNFRNGDNKSDMPVNALINLQNGGGKSSCVSFLLGMSLPHQNDCLQKKRGMNPLDAFREGQPAILIMEWEDWKAGVCESSFITGYIVTRKKDELVKKFFSCVDCSLAQLPELSGTHPDVILSTWLKLNV